MNNLKSAINDCFGIVEHLINQHNFNMYEMSDTTNIDSELTKLKDKKVELMNNFETSKTEEDLELIFDNLLTVICDFKQFLNNLELPEKDLNQILNVYGLNNISNNEDYRLIKVKSSISGYGIKTGDSIKKGCKIMYYEGEVISADELNIRLKDKSRNRSMYFDLGTDEFIDGSVNGNLAMFINHSCAPNTRTSVVSNKEGDSVVKVSALVDIKPGDELFYDYGKDYFRKNKIMCLCGSSKCFDKLLSTPSLRDHNEDQVLLFLFFFFLSF